MRQLYLVDNSVLQRIHRSDAVAEALIDLLESGELASCLPQLLEEGYSARSADEHSALIDATARAKVFLPPDANVVRLAVDLQRRLFATGRGRSVGVSDLQIAATALRSSVEDQRVTVVHYDADFEHVAAVEPTFSHHWIVPRGSAD
ncbi:PIN domain-containing protein [Microbacterium sp. NPDC077644]|uniref:PIN domain-containing protein n=1 Tax=Microbacterium sp. NPDC077644 TaxID=3155055 RepID=UPI00344D863D